MRTRAGWLLSVLASLLLLVSAAMKVVGGPDLAQGFNHLGWPVTLAISLAILEAAVTLVYLVPRTSVLGAILVTAYMGGAVATHVRVGDPFVVQILLGVAVWAGLYLREPRLTALLPFRT